MPSPFPIDILRLNGIFRLKLLYMNGLEPLEYGIMWQVRIFASFLDFKFLEDLVHKIR